MVFCYESAWQSVPRNGKQRHWQQPVRRTNGVRKASTVGKEMSVRCSIHLLFPLFQMADIELGGDGSRTFSSRGSNAFKNTKLRRAEELQIPNLLGISASKVCLSKICFERNFFGIYLKL